MKITYKKQDRKWEPCPEVDGELAQIVDVTDIFTLTSTQYDDKEVFRFILEINELNEEGYRYTVSTRPFTVSLHEKANLRKFVEKVLGRALTEQELEAGFDPESLVGKYCKISVEHVEVDDKTFANIVLTSKAKEPINGWDTDFKRLRDRENREPDAKAPKAVKKPKSVKVDEPIEVPEGIPTEQDAVRVEEYEKFFKTNPESKK
jgi:hypothetical protein